MITFDGTLTDNSQRVKIFIDGQNNTNPTTSYFPERAALIYIDRADERGWSILGNDYVDIGLFDNTGILSVSLVLDFLDHTIFTASETRRPQVTSVATYKIKNTCISDKTHTALPRSGLVQSYSGNLFL